MDILDKVLIEEVKEREEEKEKEIGKPKEGEELKSEELPLNEIIIPNSAIFIEGW